MRTHASPTQNIANSVPDSDENRIEEFETMAELTPLKFIAGFCVPDFPGKFHANDELRNSKIVFSPVFCGEA
jgi:hypothetical protein